MAKIVDPEAIETRVIHDLVDFTDKRVIEIGCGDGRMLWRYARQAESVLGIDPSQDFIDAARAAAPEELAGRVAFEVGDAVTDEFSGGPYDVAVLAWSL
ncbi:MAG: class I SAM-dependent methyltransferase [Dehalococcoidia bacterium]|nr:class I SAM-dependent methyltransferase [Dehalococcoidia bacterium]